MSLHARMLSIAAAGAVLWSASAANAAGDATGIWFDHNGRGAVEIAPCASGKGLCGYVVHIKEAKNAKRCGMQILGNVTSGGGGWIYSPDRGRKYPVALTRLSDNSLRVVGNAGSMFSKTFTWNRAPDDVARCGETTAAAPETETAPAPKAEKKAKPRTEQAAAPAPSERTVLTGASSASVALLAAPRGRMTDAAPQAVPTAVEDTKPAAAPAPAADAADPEPAPAPKKAAATQEAAPEDTAEEETFNAEPERKCKFKIPYVGRVISVPCRD